MSGAREPRPTSLWQEFCRYIELRRAEGLTFRSQTRSLRLLANHLHGLGIDEARQVSSDHLGSFFEAYGHRKASSFNNLVSVAHGLFRWLTLQEVIPESPLKVKRRRKSERRVHVIFDDDALAAGLLRLADLRERGPQPLRRELWTTLFAVLASLGLREMEGASIRLEDVDLAACTLFVRKGKFSKERIVPFGPKLAQYLDRFMRLRRARGAGPADFLFTFTGRRPVGPDSIYLAFKNYMLPGMGHHDEYRRAYVHDLRHTFAVQTLVKWYRAGVNPNDFLDDLSIFMGHVSVESTAEYLAPTAEILGISSERFEAFSTSVWQAIESV
jgi:site-specific recombinase XerD